MIIERSRGKSENGDPNMAPIVTTIKMESHLRVGVGTPTMIITMPIPYANEVSQKIDRLVDTVEKHIPEPQKKQYREAVDSKLDQIQKKGLSISDIISIISLLFSFYFQHVNSLPDAQMKKVIAQNEIIIEQQQEEIRLLQERNAMLQAITDAIENISDLFDTNSEDTNVLNKGTDILSNSSDSSSDVSDQEAKPDHTDSHHENCDTQKQDPDL